MRSSHKVLLTGSSLLAVAAELSLPNAALASCGSGLSGGNVTISSCITNFVWTSGNLALTNGGTINASSSAALLVSSATSVGNLTNGGTIISGGTWGVLNHGAIAAITNNGQIIGNTAGIYNDGTITVLSNTGTISTGRYGIINTGASSGFGSAGSIGTLTNSGTITGSKSGINNTSGIGTLNNNTTGTISGTSSYGIYNNGGNIGVLANSGVITGGILYGIYNNTRLGSIGQITALTNSGTISGGSTGIFNYGSIASLTNSGTISGGLAGITNYRGIGTINNSGTITGSVDAINNTIGAGTSGTIGFLINSGVIAGNILNATSNPLTIGGGSGGTFGTFTGYSAGSVGTITNTASNLTFASGNILLGDDINVGSYNVINAGATLKLTNVRTITGNYSQNGGGLVVGVVSPSSYGSLRVSGNAIVTNAAITISGTGLTAGETFTIVHAGLSGSYTQETATVSGTNGLTASVSATGTDLLVALAVSSSGTGGGGGGTISTNYTAKGLAGGGAAVGMGPSLDIIAGSTSPVAVAFQNAVLVPLAALSSLEQPAAIRQLAPTQLFRRRFRRPRPPPRSSNNMNSPCWETAISVRRPGQPVMPTDYGDKSWAAAPCAATPPMPTATGRAISDW